MALCSLCKHKRSQQKLVLERVSEQLLQLLQSSEDEETLACASCALCHLCHNKSTRARLVKEGVIPVTVKEASEEGEPGATGGFVC